MTWHDILPLGVTTPQWGKWCFFSLRTNLYNLRRLVQWRTVSEIKKRDFWLKRVFHTLVLTETVPFEFDNPSLGPVSLTVFPSQFKFDGNFRFTLTSILIQWSLQNLVHGTTTVLSWHVQKFVAIWWPATDLWQGEVSIQFELRANKPLVKRAPGRT